jgi:hypothetical protein
MEVPNNEEAEASIPNKMLLSGTATHALRRKAAKRTETCHKIKMKISQQQRKKSRLDPIIKRTAAVTNYDVMEIFSDSDDEKPKAIVNSLLGKKRKRTPIATSTAEAAITTASRSGRWTTDEDNKLKDAVQMHGGKDWAAIAALIPCRTLLQCTKRWHYLMKRFRVEREFSAIIEGINA